MLFGWSVVKHVKSNAIVYAAKDRTLGIGAGQMSRVDSSRIAIWKAGKPVSPWPAAWLPATPSSLSPTASSPPPKPGHRAIQPGGSVRDHEVIQAADEREFAMVFTGIRHFRH